MRMIARRSGNENMMSVNRITRLSTMLPPNAASDPIDRPMHEHDELPSPIPICSEMRIPSSTRANMSRPSWSVPNQ